MPANRKYLTTNVWVRTYKLTLSIFGTLFNAIGLYYSVLAMIQNPTVVTLHFSYLFFIIWLTLFLISFLFSNSWKLTMFFVLSAIACWLPSFIL